MESRTHVRVKNNCSGRRRARTLRSPHGRHRWRRHGGDAERARAPSPAPRTGVRGRDGAGGPEAAAADQVPGDPQAVHQDVPAADIGARPGSAHRRGRRRVPQADRRRCAARARRPDRDPVAPAARGLGRTRCRADRRCSGRGGSRRRGRRAAPRSSQARSGRTGGRAVARRGAVTRGTSVVAQG